MSFKTRVFLALPVALVGSWLAVKSLAAPREAPVDDPPLASSTAALEVQDPALAAAVSRFAAGAWIARR
jgi:hypothetical protein